MKENGVGPLEEAEIGNHDGLAGVETVEDLYLADAGGADADRLAPGDPGLHDVGLGDTLSRESTPPAPMIPRYGPEPELGGMPAPTSGTAASP